MEGYQFLDGKGTFRLKNPELTSYLYFPLANESGVMSSVTPTFGGDSKMGQNTFLLAPVSSEDLHNNKSSRNFWCNIKGKGSWSATGRSAKQEADLFTEEKEDTVLEAGIMWQKVTRTSKEYGITSEITLFVPFTKDTVELMSVSIKNTGRERLELTPTAAIPLYGRSADNIRDHRHVTSLLHRIEVTKEGVVLNPTLTFDERGHHKNTMVYGVFGAAGEGELPVGFYPCVEDFIGEGGNFENPRVLLEETIKYVTEGTKADGYEVLGGIRFETVTLEPGEGKTYILVLGYGSSKEDLENKAKPYLREAVCQQALEKTKAYWIEKLNISYKTGDKDFDAWMQWVNFQPMLRRIYGCSFLPHHDYGKGGRGWRDLWQDCLALLIMNPNGVRDMLIDNFAGVRVDGSNATIIGTKQGEFIADRNSITRVWMDHGVWPFLATNLYIMQSGDLNFLLKDNYYFKDPQAVRGEDKDILWKRSDGSRLRTEAGEEYKGNIIEHMLIQHLTAFYDVGEHNHIRMRGADWNDALDMAKDRGESVAFTLLYGDNLGQMAGLILKLNAMGVTELPLIKEIEFLLTDDAVLYGNIAMKQELLFQYCTRCKHTVSGEKTLISCTELAANLKNKADWIRNHIRKTEWISTKEGHSWFNSYYDNNGRQVEGDSDTGVRMMLTGQVFAIMSHTATEEQVRDIVSAADTYLYKEEIGGYKLNTNFKELKTDLGRMFGFAYGSKENGAVFSHMAVMYANALYQRKFVPEGYKVINSLYQHLSDFNKSRTYPGIPEYIGDNGRGLYHYLTGSASWLLLTVLNEMFGIRGQLGDLKLEPKLMSEQFNGENQASAEFIFADRRLAVLYCNRSRKDYGNYKVESVFIDGIYYDLIKENGVIKRSLLENLDKTKQHIVIVNLV
ncbi:MAG: cellobiose phosphorylase [Anaerocolumna sp.]